MEFHILRFVGTLYNVISFFFVFFQEKFTPLDQQICDEEYPECTRLCNCVNQKQLGLIADLKGPEDLVVCKYNEEKTMKWLSLKVTFFSFLVFVFLLWFSMDAF